MLADLHTHTTFSDGRLSPAGLIEKAALRGLAAIAITDHDSVGALGIAEIAARRHGIKLIPGVELSADLDGREVHILGYGFEPRDPTLRSHLAAYRAARVERAREMVRRLEAIGVVVEFSRVLEIAGIGAVGRPHVAQALIEAGHVESFREAFTEMIGDGGPAHVRKPGVPVAAIVGIIHAAGGRAVIAHPGTAVSEADVRHVAEAGLDGIETVHPSHDAELTVHWQRVAVRLGLAQTGGSDYHGFRSAEEEIFGHVGIPVSGIETLLARHPGGDRRPRHPERRG